LPSQIDVDVPCRINSVEGAAEGVSASVREFYHPNILTS
jgi:hypothetical protein